MITAFPKIFSLGTDYIKDIFMDNVQVTEKIDGSQFAFGKINGHLHLRSKGAFLFTENPEKMFSEAISYIDSIQDRLPEGMVFYTEYLKKPQHNTLKYDRTPKNHLMLFGVMHISQRFHLQTEVYSELLGIEHVPVLHYGRVDSPAELKVILERESVLGGAKIEGVVVKNFDRPFLLGGQPIPIMAGKYVSESFKEVHRDRWGKEETGKGRLETFFDSFKTPARWEKAVQHLRDKGLLSGEPKDIGSLFKEVHQDIESEEKEAIKEFLWNEYNKEIKRKATAGMPEWYKQKLLDNNFS